MPQAMNREALIITGIIAFLVLFGGFTYASSESKSPRRLQQDPSIGLEYFKDYFKHTASIVASPLSWDRPTWVRVLTTTGIIAGITCNEERIQEWVQSKRGETSNRISRIVKPVGDIDYTLPALALFYTCGVIADREEFKSMALVALQSTIVTGAFTESLKYLTHKHRPASGDLNSIIWDGPSTKKQNLSFPSGHAAHSFAVATVFANQYRDRKIIPFVAYSLALTCSASRINDNQHWATDVISGALIGHLVASSIFNSYSGRCEQKQTQHINTSVMLKGDKIMLSIEF